MIINSCPRCGISNSRLIEDKEKNTKKCLNCEFVWTPSVFPLRSIPSKIRGKSGPRDNRK